MMSDVHTSLFRVCRSRLLAVAAFSFFANLLVLAIPLYTLQVFNRVLTSHNLTTLLVLSLATLLAILVLAALEVVRSRLLVHVGTWIDQTLSPVVLGRAIAAAPLTRGRADAQGLRDLETLRNFVAGPGIFHLLDSPWVPIYVGIIYIIHPALGAIALGGAAFLAAVALLNDLATRRLVRDAGSMSQAMLRWAEESVRNAEVLEAMGMRARITALWERGNHMVLARLAQASHRAGLLSAAARFGRLLVQVLVTGVGVALALEQDVTPGAVVAASILLSRALAPVEQLVGSWRSFVGARNAYARLDRFLSDRGPVRGRTSLPVPEGRLTVERVTVVLPGREQPVLDNVSFELAPGESLGVVGPSAAGKTSLARVLLGLWPASSGKVRLDGADVFTWAREDLGRHVGYMPQDFELFTGTVKQAIARMADADDRAVVQAARLTGAHGMILRLPLGYDTDLSEPGVLSGGQRQRIGLARAFFGAPRLLVLDEPNANLDADGETALMTALLHARAKGITTVAIAHRPKVLSQLDKLLVLRDGRVEHFGERQEVLHRLLPATNAVSPLRQAVS